MSRYRKANLLFRSGRYEEAFAVYCELYRENRLSLYRQSIDLCRSRLGDDFDYDTYDRVCICSSGIMGPTGAGGIATAMANLAVSLSEQGCEVTILYSAHPYYARHNFDYWKGRFWDKYKIRFAVPERSKYYGTEEMIRSYEAFRYLDSETFDCAIFHDYQGLGYFSAVASRLGLLNGVDVVINGHGNMELSYHFGSRHKSSVSECIVAQMERSSVRLSSALIAPSSNYLKFWSEITELPKKASVIPNINTIEVEHSLLGNMVDSNNERVEMAIGFDKNFYFYSRLERLKGLDLFIDFAIAKSEESMEKCFFWFYGTPVTIDGKKSDVYISDRLDGSSVNYDIVLNPTPTQFFSDVKKTKGVLVFASLGENSPCTVAEACNHNVPLIASDIPGIREMLDADSENRCLFKTGDLKDLLRVSRVKDFRAYAASLAYLHGELYRDWFSLFHDLKKNSMKAADIAVKTVSVIIPTIGRVDTLKETLASFSKQTYLPLEVIVVDDGSTIPNDLECLCASYDAKYVRTEKVYKGAACNFGAKISEGEILVFFDDDDLPHENYIKSFVRAFSSSDVDVISSFAGVFEKYDPVTNLPRVEYISMSVGGELGVNLLANYFGKGCFAIKKTSFEFIGGFEVDDELIPFVDYRFYLKCYMSGLNISVIPLAMYFYRKNSSQSLFQKSKNPVALFKAKRKIFDEIKRSVDSRFHDTMNYIIDNVSQPTLSK